MPDADDEVGLYEIRKKIYPRSVTGRFASWRVALVIATQVVFYGLPWLYWNDRQAVLFDLTARKFYIFGLVFWPQDVIYLTVLLILSALSLFLFTAVAGRLWCGYACPQTVYTEIFLWIERKIEGDRQARIRLDAAPLSLEKFVKKTLKHTAWITLAIWTGYTFVGYFEPIRDLGIRTITWNLGGWESFWIVFYGFATYGNAGWMREQVCKYMCPYARFQSVMFDHDTLVIAYDRERGEPRGSRSRKIDRQGRGPGRLHRLQHLRAGLPDRHRHPQGAAIRMHRLRRLHRRLRPGDGQDGLSARPHPLCVARTRSNIGSPTARCGGSVFRPRTLLYTAILLLVAGAAGVSLYLKNPLKMDVIRDRGALARESSPGIIENVYRIQIMNTDEKPRGVPSVGRGLARNPRGRPAAAGRGRGGGDAVVAVAPAGAGRCRRAGAAQDRNRDRGGGRRRRSNVAKSPRSSFPIPEEPAEAMEMPRCLPAMRTPWYRQRWPWLLMAGPALVVVASLYSGWLAVTSDDGVVADDYYKRGLSINRRLERVDRAAALKLVRGGGCRGGRRSPGDAGFANAGPGRATRRRAAFDHAPDARGQRSQGRAGARTGWPLHRSHRSGAARTVAGRRGNRCMATAASSK